MNGRRNDHTELLESFKQMLEMVAKMREESLMSIKERQESTITTSTSTSTIEVPISTRDDVLESIQPQSSWF